jgi:hypothetical protein
MAGLDGANWHSSSLLDDYADGPSPSLGIGGLLLFFLIIYIIYFITQLGWFYFFGFREETNSKNNLNNRVEQQPKAEVVSPQTKTKSGRDRRRVLQAKHAYSVSQIEAEKLKIQNIESLEDIKTRIAEMLSANTPLVMGLGSAGDDIIKNPPFTNLSHHRLLSVNHTHESWDALNPRGFTVDPKRKNVVCWEFDLLSEKGHNKQNDVTSRFSGFDIFKRSLQPFLSPGLTVFIVSGLGGWHAKYFLLPILEFLLTQQAKPVLVGNLLYLAGELTQRACTR